MSRPVADCAPDAKPTLKVSGPIDRRIPITDVDLEASLRLLCPVHLEPDK